jgi:hypothetical protein
MYKGQRPARRSLPLVIFAPPPGCIGACRVCRLLSCPAQWAAMSMVPSIQVRQELPALSFHVEPSE